MKKGKRSVGNVIDFKMAIEALAELDRIIAAHPELVCHDGDRWEESIGMLISAMDYREGLDCDYTGLKVG